jgi:hypothetical protein
VNSNSAKSKLFSKLNPKSILENLKKLNDESLIGKATPANAKEA